MFNRTKQKGISIVSVLALCCMMILGGTAGALGADTSPPDQPVPLIFIHHSSGENWLSDDNGGLGLELMANNYYVSDTNYGWGPDAIGDRTDIGNWWTWFRGPDSSTYLNAVLTEKGQNSWYSRLGNSPAGNNKIVMFKSCFPNSALQGSASVAVPSIGSNPLRDQDSGSEYMTAANARGIYIDLLNCFKNHPDVMFVAITAPPLIDSSYAANARAFNQWLVNDWLDGYSTGNVFVYDFYNVLTSNGGSPEENDYGQENGNHHRVWNGVIQHQVGVSSNTSAYPTEDDHPSWAGNQKATGEFVPWLNCMYNAWRAAMPADTASDDTSIPEEPVINGNEETIKVFIDNEELYCEVPPMVQNETVLVPLRAIYEALGATVEWIQETQTGILNRDGTEVTVTVGDHLAYVNGISQFLEIPPLAVSNRILVPLRFAAESLGAEPIWNQDTLTVEIRTGSGGLVILPYGSYTNLVFYLDSSTYYGNGSPLTMDSPPIAIAGRTYMPIRYATEPVGAAVSWEESEQKAVIEANGNVIEIWIGRNTGMVNGVEKMLDEDNPDGAAFVSSEGRIMVPVRFIAENLGYSVSYKNLDGSVTISCSK